MAIQVELHITGLAILDTDSKMIYFIDTSSVREDHRHHSLITFRPDDYVGPRFPPIEGTADLFRAGISGDFQTSFPLRGAVTVGTEDEIQDENAPLPTIGTNLEETGLRSLDEIVSLTQLGYTGYSGFAGGHAAKASASIRLVGGELYAAKRMIDRVGEHQLFDKDCHVGLHFSEHIVWRRVIQGPKPRLFVYERDHESAYILGLKAALKFSMTNLPTHGWLGSTADREYFRHLERLASLGVATGTFKPPTPPPLSSSGSESCSPSKRP